MNYKKRVQIFFAVIVIWAIGTVVSTHLKNEPYPATAYPGFGVKRTNFIVYHELYHLNENGKREILFKESGLKAARFRRFVKNMYCHILEEDVSPLEVKKKVLLDLPFSDEGDSMYILLKLTDWGESASKTITLDSVAFNLDVEL